MVVESVSYLQSIFIQRKCEDAGIKVQKRNQMRTNFNTTPIGT